MAATVPYGKEKLVCNVRSTFRTVQTRLSDRSKAVKLESATGLRMDTANLRAKTPENLQVQEGSAISP